MNTEKQRNALKMISDCFDSLQSNWTDDLALRIYRWVSDSVKQLADIYKQSCEIENEFTEIKALIQQSQTDREDDDPQKILKRF